MISRVAQQSMVTQDAASTVHGQHGTRVHAAFMASRFIQYCPSIAIRADQQKGTVHPQNGLSAILCSRGTGRNHHAVGMRHCPRSEECKGINTSFPRNAFDSSFFLMMVGPLGPGKMSKVYILETFRDSKGINTAKKRRPNQAVTSRCTLIY